ncbi:MAG: hypothetical protein PWQ57_220 [Desulfovibrionales bacterium]|nr:hypothetical protein [Desulfovibrionales bacterium]
MKKTHAVYLALAACLLLAAPARAEQDFRLAASPCVKAVDGDRKTLQDIENRISDSLENELDAGQTFALHDLAFMCRQGAIELHDIVDVFLMESTPGVGKSFESSKRKELAGKAQYAVWDVAKRIEFVKINAKGPYADPERWSVVRGFALEMEKALEPILGNLKKLQALIPAE